MNEAFHAKAPCSCAHDIIKLVQLNDGRVDRKSILFVKAKLVPFVFTSFAVFAALLVLMTPERLLSVGVGPEARIASVSVSCLTIGMIYMSLLPVCGGMFSELR